MHSERMWRVDNVKQLCQQEPKDWITVDNLDIDCSMIVTWDNMTTLEQRDLKDAWK